MRYRQINDNNPASPKKENKWIRLLRLAAVFVVLMAIYMVGVSHEIKAIVYIYYALLFVSSVAFVVINRGFDRQPPTPDMLPDNWSAVQKCEYIESDKKRKKIARYLLYLVIPLLFIFGIDIVYMGFFA